MDIIIDNRGIPYQIFNNKKYWLYPGAKYFIRASSKAMHRDIWEFYNGKRPIGFHVHHKDCNPWNNNINNLELKEGKTHSREHAKKRFLENPEWAKSFYTKGNKAANIWHGSEEGIQWHKEQAARFNFGKATYGEMKCQICNTVFIKKNINTKFCSGTCKNKWRLLSGVDNISRTCKNCGNIFTVNKYCRTLCCSPICSNKLISISRMGTKRISNK
jgi:hypothetical protein